MLNFKIEKKIEKTLGGVASLGRAGVLETAHGVIHTPAFVAVGTKATVKSLTPALIKDAGTEVVLGNTYHLYLQPGDEVVRDAGGIGRFMGWSGPTMTDSGGFQVFSLGAAFGKDISKVVKVTDPSLMIPERFDDDRTPALAKIGQDGVSFKSHLDGSIHYITPEKSIQIQHNLGADMIFAFDECTSPAEDLKYQEEALERTHRWAKRCLEEHVKLSNLVVAKVAKNYSLASPLDKGDLGGFVSGHFDSKDDLGGFAPALFGIVQGGRDESLRKKSAKIIAEMRVGEVGFDGFGIGGSFAKEDMSTAVKWVNEILPEEKPRHLLGIGEPEDLFMGIEQGVDLFDCVIPTRLGRNGTIFTKRGKIIITNSEYRNDFTPIEEDCGCYACSTVSRSLLDNGKLPFTKAYIGHLFRGKEMLAGTLGSAHNLYFLVNLVKQIRQSILDGNFYEFKEVFLSNYKK